MYGYLSRMRRCFYLNTLARIVFQLLIFYKEQVFRILSIMYYMEVYISHILSFRRYLSKCLQLLLRETGFAMNTNRVVKIKDVSTHMLYLHTNVNVRKIALVKTVRFTVRVFVFISTVMLVVLFR